MCRTPERFFVFYVVSLQTAQLYYNYVHSEKKLKPKCVGTTALLVLSTTLQRSSSNFWTTG